MCTSACKILFEAIEDYWRNKSVLFNLSKLTLILSKVGRRWKWRLNSLYYTHSSIFTFLPFLFFLNRNLMLPLLDTKEEFFPAIFFKLPYSSLFAQSKMQSFAFLYFPFFALILFTFCITVPFFFPENGVEEKETKSWIILWLDGA